MRSTFMGLETARRGMFTQQGALYTTGHNIANANTPGYSRQRINFVQTSPYPSIGLNRPQLPGQMGTGVAAGSVQRIRESFLDMQYRVENNKIGYYGSLSESLLKMEGILNEPTDKGLHSTLEKFWNSLQDLAGHTENSGARDVVAATGQMVADTFNYYYNSLSRIQRDIGQQIDVKVDEINSLVDQIHKINGQISEVEPHGYLPNDLYDERDSLVDKLSKMINIKVTNVKPTNYGNAKDIAEGLYNIEIVSEDGNSYSPPLNLITVSKASGIIGTNKLALEKDADGLIENATVGGKNIPDFKFKGELLGLIESYGYKQNGNTVGYYPDMIEKINKVAEAFANEFNKIHSEGYALGATAPSGENFFVFETGNTNYAQAIKVNEVIIKDPTKIAAGDGSGDSGNNKNAQNLADLKTKSFSEYDDPKYQTLPGNLDTYYSGIIGKLGVDSQSAQKNLGNSEVLAHSVEYNRQSISGVSLDEEFTNLIRFQHAYNASARNITAIDEMLDKIINGMGIVGR